MEQEKSCGFGNKNKFYKPGAENSLYLTKPIRNCESLVYGEKILKSSYRFGKGKSIKSIIRDIKYLKKL